MKKFLVGLLIGFLLVTPIIAWTSSTLQGNAGGTGINSATTSQVGYYLQVSSSSPTLLYTFAPISSGGGGSGSVGSSTLNYFAAYNATTTVTGTSFLTLGSNGITFTNATGTNLNSVTATYTSVTTTNFSATTSTITSSSITTANVGTLNVTTCNGCPAGATTLATQQAWTSVFTATAVNTTTVTTTLATQAVASTTAGVLENKLMRWTNTTGVTQKYGWIKAVSQSSTILTLTVNGDAVTTTDSNFRVSLQHEVKSFHWYVPGQCVADANNSVGAWYSIPTTSVYMLSFDGLLGQPDTSTLTINIYASTTADGVSTALTGTAPDFGANGWALNNQPFGTRTINGQAIFSLRTPACGSGGSGSDLNVNAYYMPLSWQPF